MVNTKNAFWQALLFTIFIFVIGLMFGLFIENSRANTFENYVSKSETNLLDEQIRNKLITDSNVSCTLSLNSIFAFADRIYYQAELLEKYDSVSKLSDDLKEVHKRYDLLRLLLWNEMQISQKKCNYDKIHTIVYFFDYKSDDVNKKSEQQAFSNLVIDLKNKYPDNILIVPIAANLNIESVDIIFKNYNISSSPSLLIDNNLIISDLPSFSELEKIVLQSNKE